MFDQQNNNNYFNRNGSKTPSSVFFFQFRKCIARLALSIQDIWRPVDLFLEIIAFYANYFSLRARAHKHTHTTRHRWPISS